MMIPRSASQSNLEYRQCFNEAGNGSTVNISNEFTRLSGGDDWNMEGQDIENYHERLKKKELLPHTNYSNFSRIITSDGEFDVSKPNGDFQRWRPAWHLAESNYLLYEQDLLNKVEELNPDFDLLVQKAASQIYSGGHDSLTFLAELHKVRRMFKELIPKIIKLIRGKSLHEIHRLWLEARYGWRTLIFDLEDLEAALTDFDSKRLRHSQRSGDTIAGSSEDIKVVNASTASVRIVTSLNWELSARGAVTADLLPPQFRANAVATAWELVPFSFVIDWVLDIGSFLESLSFLAISRNHEASYGYQLTLTKQVTWDKVSFRNGYTSGNISCYNACDAKLQFRQPSQVLNPPQTTLNLNAWKVADLLALLLVLYRR